MPVLFDNLILVSLNISPFRVFSNNSRIYLCELVLTGLLTNLKGTPWHLLASLSK